MPRKPAAKKPKPKKRFEFFITTVPKMRPCEKCGHWIFAGIVDGLHTRADMVQLDDQQSLLAIIAGLQLYSLTRTGLVHLDVYRLQDPKFAGRLPQHRCGTVWPRKVKGAGEIRPSSLTDTPPY